MLDKYLPRTDFDSYEDFLENYRVNIPDNFNFGFDIIDAWADRESEKLALMWCDDNDEERSFSYDDLRRLSNQAANYLTSLGIGKGDVVMCILRRRFEYWITAIALCKLGAVLIPASMQLTSKDTIYRANSAKVKAVICVNDDFVITQMEQALPECPTIEFKIMTPGEREGWLVFNEALPQFSDVFERPLGDLGVGARDTMLIYFTSGTTGMPKMVQHNFAHPLGHIVTAKYWQQVRQDKLHMSVSDSGWAKFGWGKIYGQLICGAPVFA